MVNSYFIERHGESWLLRFFGRQDAMISGATVDQEPR